MKLRARALLVLVALAVLAATACGGSEANSPTIRVMAASSLADAFESIAEGFTAETGIEVELITAGSSTIATQIEEGAPFDVVALADQATMERLVGGAKVAPESIELFASNHLVLAVPTGNPAGITTLGDLDDATLAICAPQVPCGALTQEVASANNITLSPATEEPSVRSVRTKLELDEVDAGFIYATDLTSQIEVVPIANIEQYLTRYPVAAAVDNPASALDFIDYLMADTAVLAGLGFGPGGLQP